MSVYSYEIHTSQTIRRSFLANSVIESNKIEIKLANIQQSLNLRENKEQIIANPAVLMTEKSGWEKFKFNAKIYTLWFLSLNLSCVFILGHNIEYS